MSDDWEADDFVPNFENAKTDQWAGEDEEETVKDNWEDDDEPKPAEKEPEATTQQPTKRKTKKQFAKKIADKEAERNGSLEGEEATPVTQEDMLNEKIRVRKMQETADLKLARELLGTQSIDLMDPKESSEFTTFKDALVEKISLYQKSTHFTVFLEDLLTNIAAFSDTEELKKLGLIFTNLYHEKNRQQKEEKKKKQKKKVTLNVGRNDISDLVDVAEHGSYDDYGEDFM